MVNENTSFRSYPTVKIDFKITFQFQFFKKKKKKAKSVVDKSVKDNAAQELSTKMG